MLISEPWHSLRIAKKPLSPPWNELFSRRSVNDQSRANEGSKTDQNKAAFSDRVGAFGIGEQKRIARPWRGNVGNNITANGRTGRAGLP